MPFIQRYQRWQRQMIWVGCMHHEFIIYQGVKIQIANLYQGRFALLDSFSGPLRPL